jgi:hypothetical protein
LLSDDAKAPVIERRYLSQHDACTEAIKTLLKKRGRLLDKGDLDDVNERSKDDVNAKQQYTG